MSDGHFSGRYPGGPRRAPDETEKRSPRQALLSVGEIAERAQHATLRKRRRRRVQRILLGLLLMLGLAGGVGAWMGIRSYRTAEQLAAERDQQAAPALSEDDRLLRELIRLQLEQSQSQPQSPGAGVPGAGRAP